LIVGLGIDIAEVGRVKAAIERYGEPFLRRVYTAKEREYCERFKNKYERYAGRFAAKEAAMKALGTGHSHGVLWRDVEVVRRGGPPQLRLHGGAARRFESMGGRSSLLTITHTDTLAVAQVLILGD
jgi:holo-[acyl-carrier protein] synthase